MANEMAKKGLKRMVISIEIQLNGEMAAEMQSKHEILAAISRSNHGWRQRRGVM